MTAITALVKSHGFFGLCKSLVAFKIQDIFQSRDVTDQ